MRLNSGRLGFRVTDTYLQRIRKKDHRLRTETERTWHGIRGNNLKQKTSGQSFIKTRSKYHLEEQGETLRDVYCVYQYQT